MSHCATLLKLNSFLDVTIIFGVALYIRHLARQKGLWRDFVYSFSGNIRFYCENWREVRFPLFLMLLAILLLIGCVVMAR